MSADPQFVQRCFPDEWLNYDAVDVVLRLKSRGYEAYFVGGCVRDLILERPPKDFDIVTDAHPEEVKDVFGRCCRLIGRRFRLAHVRSGASMFEVATFRGPTDEQVSEDDTGFVVRSNAYGTMLQDAHSRDFTMNGLFYDPTEQVIKDYVGGIADLNERRVATIGPPDQRFREDPVRILRAIRLATRLDLELEPHLQQAAKNEADQLSQCPSARLLEEMCRIVESGYSRACVEWLLEFGALEVLLPEAGPFMANHAKLMSEWLGEIDRLSQAHGPLPRATVFSLLIYPVAVAALESRGLRSKRRDWGQQLVDDMKLVGGNYGIPIRWRERARAALNIMGGQLYDGKRPPTRSLRSPALPIATAMLRMLHRVGHAIDCDGFDALVERGQELGFPEGPFQPVSEERTSPRAGGEPARNPRKRRRRSRRRSSDAKSSES